eukprot:TRINITY_DN1896_c0_g1_i2.p1 TRINITY_DN1896_c0_g1~~TRINITY_DN1896_c0_g1_i2.p1  ORF type:complete len:146 (+),score=34.44 TRINITY_DN1896_c0_g1_i2:98-535(+)
MSTSSCNKPAKMDVTRFVCSKRRPVSEYELCTAFGEAAAAQAREATAKGELECFEDENERIYFPPAKCDAASLEATISAIDAEIAKLSSMSASVAPASAQRQRINDLHEYNDIKDACQSLMGQLASMQGVSTKELYSRFGLDLED